MNTTNGVVTGMRGYPQGIVFWINETPPQGTEYYIPQPQAAWLTPILLASLTSGKTIQIAYNPPDGSGPASLSGGTASLVDGLSI